MLASLSSSTTSSLFSASKPTYLFSHVSLPYHVSRSFSSRKQQTLTFCRTTHRFHLCRSSQVRFQHTEPSKLGESENDSRKGNESNDHDTEPKYPDDAWTRFTNEFNALTTRLPRTATLAIGAARLSSFLAIYNIIQLYPALVSGVGPGLVLGYLAHVATRRFQTPINMAITPVIAKAFPRVSQFHCSFLTSFVAPSGGFGSPRITNFMNWLNGPIDSYGFAYFLAGRVTTAAVVLGVAGLLNQGVDLQSWLSSWGVASTFQSEVTLMTGAFLVNSFLVPLHFYGGLLGLRAVGRILDQKWEAQSVAEAAKGFRKFKTAQTKRKRSAKSEFQQKFVMEEEQKTKEDFEQAELVRLEFIMMLAATYLVYRVVKIQGKVFQTGWGPSPAADPSKLSPAAPAVPTELSSPKSAASEAEAWKI